MQARTGAKPPRISSLKALAFASLQNWVLFANAQPATLGLCIALARQIVVREIQHQHILSLKLIELD